MLDGSKLTAADIMTKDVVTVYPHTSLIYVAKLLADRHISGMPVVDEDGHVVGLVSEADLVKWHDHDTEKRAWWLNMLAEGRSLEPGFLDSVRSEQEKVRTVMHSEVVSVEPTTPVAQVAQLLADKAIKRVPVIHEGKLLGIVSRGDLVRVLANG